MERHPPLPVRLVRGCLELAEDPGHLLVASGRGAMQGCLEPRVPLVGVGAEAAQCPHDPGVALAAGVPEGRLAPEVRAVLVGAQLAQEARL